MPTHFGTEQVRDAGRAGAGQPLNVVRRFQSAAEAQAWLNEVTGRPPGVRGHRARTRTLKEARGQGAVEEDVDPSEAYGPPAFVVDFGTPRRRQ